ncbi:MAG: PEP-CTERM sorting domain-containing protein [Leptolyngbyaceae cyanobacterium bins.59]|nr:PEP-CTERM sorting domain-containing protein [Leptolyngbyaceae cyanobacterium bins.59]
MQLNLISLKLGIATVVLCSGILPARAATITYGITGGIRGSLTADTTTNQITDWNFTVVGNSNPYNRFTSFISSLTSSNLQFDSYYVGFNGTGESKLNLQITDFNILNPQTNPTTISGKLNYIILQSIPQFGPVVIGQEPIYQRQCSGFIFQTCSNVIVGYRPVYGIGFVGYFRYLQSYTENVSSQWIATYPTPPAPTTNPPQPPTPEAVPEASTLLGIGTLAALGFVASRKRKQFA